MSLGKFLAHIWDAIKKLFEGLPEEFKNAIHIGVAVVEKIKEAVDSPVADIITAIIPTDIDDNIKQKLRDALPKILAQLQLAENCADLTNTADIVRCAIETLKGMEGDIKSAFWHDIAVLVAQVASDGKLSWSDGVYVLQYYYEHKFKNSDS